MKYDYDLLEIKEQITDEQIFEVLAEYHAEPINKNGIIIAKTICHNDINNLADASHKLYYYTNTKLFHCYTGCAEPSFDIFELVNKIESRTHEDWSLPKSVAFIAEKFGFVKQQYHDDTPIESIKDFELLARYDRINNIDLNTQEIELKTYDGGFLKNLPRPKIEPWLNEGISQEVMDNVGICYDPKNCGIVIPHYDINGNLIGIRERTLIQEQAEKYGKYMPAKIAGKMYNHPLSFNLYNLNNSKDNIRQMRKAFVFEGEKSCLKYASYFGMENDLSVACCGSSFINYQAWLLINQGAEEIIICLDKQFKEIGDDEFKKLVRNLKQIHKKYGTYTKISYMFDKTGLLGYKDSPIDKSKEVFLELYKRRVNLYAI